ncbi:MAG: hypothetical protein Q7S06_02405 [Nanoarchaeota archaeon]|nr:hypothetical protein [Nanoarchaeota archaeon]
MKKRAHVHSLCNFFPKNRKSHKPTIFQKKNRRGWLKIVEAFIAILLVASVALIVINRNAANKDISARVYEAEISILREIQLNTTMRTLILTTQIPPSTTGVESEMVNFPVMINSKIAERTPNYLECKGKICASSNSCFLDNTGDKKEIFAQSVIITVTSGSTGYEPKQLKIFCWSR